MNRPGGNDRAPNFLITMPTCRSRMKTRPVSSGESHITKRKKTNAVTQGCSLARINNNFIQVSDVVARREVSPRAVQRDFDWVNTRTPHKRDPGGSPFQMPTRLADGLGLESDLGHPELRDSLSPQPRTIPELLGPPRQLPGRRANLGCSNSCMLASDDEL